MTFKYKKLYYDGKLQDADKNHQVICPATEECIAEVAWASNQDLTRVIRSAQEGYNYWSSVSIAERTKWMYKLRDAIREHEDVLRQAVMYEMGKTYEQTEEDYISLVNSLEWYAQEIQHYRDEIIPDTDNTHHHYIHSNPIGIVAAIVAWNFPLLNLSFKLGPALAAGCSIIIKPSEYAPLSAYIVGEICDKISFPKGVINIICGEPKEIGTALCESKDIKLISMIGSSRTGRKLIQQSAKSIKRFNMELGGNAPFIVFPDANIEKAVKDLSALKFGNAGQICVAPNRIFIHETIYDVFIEQFKQEAKKYKPGFGKDSGAAMGPLINRDALTRIEQMVDDAVGKGAKIALGGKRPDEFEQGFYYEPTVLTNVSQQMRIYREEIFGPAAACFQFSDGDDLIDLANDDEAGLVSYLYTKDIDRINKYSQKLEYGEVQINGFKYAIYLPHGGIKESGVGHDCSHLALQDYLVKKRVTIAVNE